MSTCGACKHWRTHENGDERGECLAVKTEMNFDGYRKVGRELAHVSGQYASLWTRPEFGCVLWQRVAA